MNRKKRIVIFAGIGLFSLLIVFIFTEKITKSHETFQKGEAVSSSSLSPEENLQKGKNIKEESVPKKFSLWLEVPKKVKKQSEVVIPLRIKGNPGVLGMKLQLVFDESVLELLSAEEGDVFSGILTMTPPASFYSGCAFLWDGTELRKEEIKDGEILLLKFRIKADVSAGKYPISLLYEPGDIVDSQLTELAPEIEDQFVVIQ